MYTYVWVRIYLMLFSQHDMYSKHFFVKASNTYGRPLRG